jgi:hypothetical protein
LGFGARDRLDRGWLSFRAPQHLKVANTDFFLTVRNIATLGRPPKSASSTAVPDCSRLPLPSQVAHHPKSSFPMLCFARSESLWVGPPELRLLREPSFQQFRPDMLRTVRVP